MTVKPKSTSRNKSVLAPVGVELAVPQKPWRRGADLKLTKSVWEELYPAYFQINKKMRENLGLMLKVPVFIKDPLVVMEDPTLGIQEITVRLERNMGDGPTSSRVVVVDFNSDTQTLTDPVVWDDKEAWFHTPLSKNDWLPDPPKVPKDIDDITKVKNPERYKEEYRKFIEKTVINPYFHQLNAWAVVQRVLEFYEDPMAMGRPIPWGFEGNRLIVIPHAGFGEDAFYDYRSKSLWFYYFGGQGPAYTCLSFDIIACLSGQAILDGIRPKYKNLSTVQSASFQVFIGYLTAILISFFNQDIRHFVSKTAGGLAGANVMADLAKHFGQEVEGRDYLRTAFNQLKMKDVQNSLAPRAVSQVMTGAMWEILTGIARKHMEKNLRGQNVTLAQALWWTAERFRRIALQPLDLCPPCDIQFLDYAKAVIRNDVLTNPVDQDGFRDVMLEVFHHRGLCKCAFKPGWKLPEECQFYEALHKENVEFVSLDIDRLALSKTAAYYFLKANSRILHIPPKKDIQIVDLYDNRKVDIHAEQLPREIILEYIWQEELVLKNNDQEILDFGSWNGRTYKMDCGGTLVFDSYGNLLSRSCKPGTEFLTDGEVKDIKKRLKARKAGKKNIKNKRITQQILLELENLADWEAGQLRRNAIMKYLSSLIRRGLVDTYNPDTPYSNMLKPVISIDEGNAVRFELTPYFTQRDFDEDFKRWMINF